MAFTTLDPFAYRVYARPTTTGSGGGTSASSPGTHPSLIDQTVSSSQKLLGYKAAAVAGDKVLEKASEFYFSSKWGVPLDQLEAQLTQSQTPLSKAKLNGQRVMHYLFNEKVSLFSETKAVLDTPTHNPFQIAFRAARKGARYLSASMWQPVQQNFEKCSWAGLIGVDMRASVKNINPRTFAYMPEQKFPVSQLTFRSWSAYFEQFLSKLHLPRLPQGMTPSVGSYAKVFLNLVGENWFRGPVSFLAKGTNLIGAGFNLLIVAMALKKTVDTFSVVRQKTNDRVKALKAGLKESAKSIFSYLTGSLAYTLAFGAVGIGFPAVVAGLVAAAGFGVLGSHLYDRVCGKPTDV